MTMRDQEQVRAALARLQVALAGPRAALPAPMFRDRGQVLAAIDRDDGAQLRVLWERIQGFPLLTFRLWRRGPDGTLYPQRGGGFSLRAHEVVVADALAVALERTRRWLQREQGR